MDRLTELFELQLRLQRESMNVDPISLTGRERVDYIARMQQAAVHELHELLDEVTWKPWTKIEPAVHKENALREAVDVLHFVFNIVLAVVQKSPEEVARQVYESYVSKHRVNAARQAAGYDGASTKCPHCSRALDDVGVYYSREGGPYCLACGELIPTSSTLDPSLWHVCPVCSDRFTTTLIEELGVGVETNHKCGLRITKIG